MSMLDVFGVVDSKHCMMIYIYDYATFCDNCGLPFVYGCILVYACDKFQSIILFAMLSTYVFCALGTWLN